MMNSLKKHYPHPDKDMPARGGKSQDQSRQENSVHKTDGKGQAEDRANHDNAYREDNGHREAGASCGKKEIRIPVSLPDQRPNIFAEKEPEQRFPGGVTGIHVSFKSSLSISILCATIIAFLAPPGAQVLFFSLYSLSMISILVICGGKSVGPAEIWRAVFRYLIVVSREMAGLRLCLAVMSTAFFSVPDNEAMIITSGLCAVACSTVCLFQDTLALAARRRRATR
jgi:hypothetical protein